MFDPAYKDGPTERLKLLMGEKVKSKQRSEIFCGADICAVQWCAW